MRNLTAWTLRKPVNALVAVSGSALIGLLMPPLTVISLALAALVTLRHGGQQGVMVIAGGMALTALLMLAVHQSIQADLIVMGSLWAMTWLLAVTYRRTAQIAWMVLGAGAFGLLIVAGLYAWLGDPSIMWMELLDKYFRPVLEEGQLLRSAAEMDKLLRDLSRVMTGGMAALASVTLIVSLLLARWWQARLFNPGGFRSEFHGLRLGRALAILMLALVAASLLSKLGLAADMATVIWLLFFFQGMAVVHALVAQVGMNTGWLVSIYILLALMPYYASPVISGLGFVDAWFDFRRRVASPTNKS